jgi:hypothetical protein
MAGAAAVAVRGNSDSNHGKAIAVPRPRNTVRRVIGVVVIVCPPVLLLLDTTPESVTLYYT